MSAHGVVDRQMDPSCYFLFQTVLHDCINKGCGMCYPVYGMVYIYIYKRSLAAKWKE